MQKIIEEIFIKKVLLLIKISFTENYQRTLDQMVLLLIKLSFTIFLCCLLLVPFFYIEKAKYLWCRFQKKNHVEKTAIYQIKKNLCSHQDIHEFLDLSLQLATLG